MAAHNPIISNTCFYGAPRHAKYSGEIAVLLARGSIMHNLRQAVKEYDAIIASRDQDNMPFRWS